MFILLTSSIYSVSDSDTNLLYWGKFDDASGTAIDSSTGTPTLDYTVGSGTGTYLQTPLAPYSTNSITFSGDDYFTNTALDDSLSTTNKTFCAWFTNDIGAPASSNNVIMGTYNLNAGFLMWQTDEEPSTIECRFYTPTLANASAPGAYKYAHVCCRFNATDGAIFIN